MAGADSEHDEEPAPPVPGGDPAAAGADSGLPAMPGPASRIPETDLSGVRAQYATKAEPFPQPAPGPATPADPSEPAETGADPDPDGESEIPPTPLTPPAPPPRARPRAAERPESRADPFAQSGSVPTDPRFADLDRPTPRAPRQVPGASLLRRVGAHVVDRLVVLPLVGLFFLLSEALWARSSGAVSLSVEFLAAVWFVGGWLVVLLGDGLAGRSLGRRLASVRLVTPRGARPGVLLAVWHRILLDVLLVLVAFASLWLTLWRQGLDLAAPTRPFGALDYAIWIAFVANLLFLLVLLRLLDSRGRFLHDRLSGLLVVPGTSAPPVRRPLEPSRAAPSPRRKMRWREPAPKVPSFLGESEAAPEPVHEPPPRPSVVREIDPDPDLDLPGGHDRPRDLVSTLGDRMVDVFGYREPDPADQADQIRPPGVVLRVLLAPTRILLRLGRFGGLRPPQE